MAESEHTDLPASICPLPWLNLSTDVDGSTRPCCKFAHLDASSPYQLANLRDGTLDEVWNSDAMQALRRDFRAGVRPAECATCWDEEAAGIPSFRQTHLEDRGIRARPDYDDPRPAQPVALDLKLSNACNLRCRICGPVASSLWLREELSLAGDDADPFLLQNKDYFRANKITRDDAGRDVLRRWLPSLEHLEMTGGEPMLSKENREVIELIVREGRPEQMSLLLTTNATVVDERVLDALPLFGDVVLTASIDDVGDRFGYERSPARWDDAEAILRRYAAMASDRLHVSINCSVSPFNVWYLPEIIDWWASDPILAPVWLHLNLVHNPEHYCVRNLPEPLNGVVRDRLTVALDEAGERWPGHVADQLRGVIEFMAPGPRDPGAWDRFLDVTRHRDEVRDEEVAATFPELVAAAREADLWSDGMRGRVAGGVPGRSSERPVGTAPAADRGPPPPALV